MKGDFAGGSVLVLAGDQATITDNYSYNVAGAVKITYTVAYRGVELDSWEGVIDVVLY